MQMDLLISSQILDEPPESVLASIMSLDHAAMVQQLVESGFNPIEMNGDLAMLLPHTYSPDAIDGLVRLRNELDLDYAVHLFLWSIEPSTRVDSVRQGSVQALLDLINRTVPLEPVIYVMHATGASAAEFYHMPIPEVARKVLMLQFQNNARQSLEEILDRTGIPSRKIAIETVEFPLELTLELVEELDLSICFDTGHVFSGFSDPIKFFDAFDMCLPCLGEVHIHDSPVLVSSRELKHGLDHQPLGAGDLDVIR